MGVLLWCVSWADLFYSFHGLTQDWALAPVFFVTPLVVGITMVSVGFWKLGGRGGGMGVEEYSMGGRIWGWRRPQTL